MKRTFQRRHLFPLIFVVFLAFALISLNVRGNSDPLKLSTLIQFVLAPAQRGVRLVFQSVGNVWGGYLALLGVKQENERLHDENRRLLAKLAATEEVRRQNERLRDLLQFKRITPLNVLPAKVIGHASTNWAKTIVLDRGHRDGVKEKLAVVSHEGIVGHIVHTSYGNAQVLLITDVRSAVDSLVQRNRASGVVAGRNSSLLRMKYIPQETVVRVGDRIISSGLGGIYPPGLLVGHINEVISDEEGLFQDAVVVPSVNFKRLEEVLIIINEPA